MLKDAIRTIILVSIIFVIILSGNIMASYAVSQSDLNEMQQKIDATKGEIEQVERKLSAEMSKIRELNAQISDYEDEISDLNEKIEEVQIRIEETEKDLAKAEADYEEQEEKFKRRIVAMYESGSTTYLDVLLSSRSVSDFISKYYTVSKIAEYDKNLLDQMEKNKISIQETKELLATSKEQIETLKASKENTAQTLKNSQSQKQAYVDRLNDEEKALENDLEQFERDKREIQQELARIARENNGGVEVVAGDPTKAGYIFPVQGLSYYNINRPVYPSYAGHTGTDININVKGRNVLAVKDGTVVISTALKNSDGSYRSYGEYVVIDHHDGTMTLYAHMSPNTRTVQKGDNVVQGQVLGIVGTTGNSTGLHLHFEVRINGKCVNPLPYLK